jgi:hypothetical protein
MNSMHGCWPIVCFERDNRSTIYVVNGGMNKWGLYGKPVLHQEFAILVSIGNWKPCLM